MSSPTIKDVAKLAGVSISTAYIFYSVNFFYGIFNPHCTGLTCHSLNFYIFFHNNPLKFNYSITENLFQVLLIYLPIKLCYNLLQGGL